MRKRLFLMLLALSAMASYAYDFEVDGIGYNLLSLEDRTVEVASTDNVDQNQEELFIPASVTFNGKELKVVSIGESAVDNFNHGGYSDKNWKKIHLPATIEIIGDKAFRNQDLLEEIELPESLISIGECAFDYCDKLKTVSVNAGLKKVGYWAFRGCSQLEEITLPEGLETISIEAFALTGLRSFHFPGTLKYIGTGIFYGCKNLEYVDLEGLASFGKLPSGLFKESYIKRVVFPDWVTEIPDMFFYNCHNLEELDYGKSSIKSIGDKAFQYCNFLGNFSFPEGVKSVGLGAFSGAKISGTISVPSSIEEMYKSAFCFIGDSLIFQPSDKPLMVKDDTSPSLNVCYNINYLHLGRKLISDYFQNEDPESDLPPTTYYYASVVELSQEFLSNQQKYVRDVYWQSRGYNAVKRLAILDGVENLDYKYDCKETRSLLLPSTLKAISASSFIDATGLLNVDCRATEPPTFDEKLFADMVYFKAKLTVPIGCKEAYQNAEGWKNFWTIEESEQPVYDDSENEIREVADDSHEWFSIFDGELKAHAPLEIYTLDGRLVKHILKGEATDVAQGMYVIRCGSRTAKVAL